MTTITTSSGNIVEIPNECRTVVSPDEPLVCPWCRPGVVHRKLFRVAAVFSFGATTLFVCADHNTDDKANAYQYIPDEDYTPISLREKAIHDVYLSLAEVSQGCIEPYIANEIAIKAVNEALNRSEPK